MKNLALLFATCCYLSAPSVLGKSKINYVKETQRLLSANIERDVRDAVNHKDIRFRSVLGFTEEVPGVEEFEKKWAKNGTQPIEGPSDSTEGPVEEKFEKAAEDYARNYNRELIRVLTKDKTCKDSSECNNYPCVKSVCLVLECKSDEACPNKLCGLHLTPTPGFCTTNDDK